MDGKNLTPEALRRQQVEAQQRKTMSVLVGIFCANLIVVLAIISFVICAILLVSTATKQSSQGVGMVVALVGGLVLYATPGACVAFIVATRIAYKSILKFEGLKPPKSAKIMKNISYTINGLLLVAALTVMVWLQVLLPIIRAK